MKDRSDNVFGRLADKSYSEFVRARTQDEALEILAREDTLVLVERGKPRSLKMRCPCESSHILTVNLDEAIGLAWHLRIIGSSVTLFPSVWLDTGCQCHFILRRNRIYIVRRRAKSTRDRLSHGYK